MINAAGVIDQNHLLIVCGLKAGTGTCRYLWHNKGYRCAKGTGMEQAVLERSSRKLAQGDNCSGPPSFDLPLVSERNMTACKR